MKKSSIVLVSASLVAFIAGCGSSSSSKPGIDLNVSQTDLENKGWSICYSDEYDQSGELLANILTACSGEELMLACREVGDPNFVVAAHAAREDVTYDTGTDRNTSHNANGVEWYYNDDWSWGFAKGGDGVDKFSCDINTTNGEYRMCVHTETGTLDNGWRCGTTINLNNGVGWERVFLTK